MAPLNQSDIYNEWIHQTILTRRAICDRIWANYGSSAMVFCPTSSVAQCRIGSPTWTSRKALLKNKSNSSDYIITHPKPSPATATQCIPLFFQSHNSPNLPSPSNPPLPTPTTPSLHQPQFLPIGLPPQIITIIQPCQNKHCRPPPIYHYPTSFT